MDIRVRRTIGGGLWVVGFGVAVIWGSLANYGVEGRGYGFSPPVNVAALETGRVASLPLPLHAQVASGDIVVHFDPAPLEEEREWVRARLLAATEMASMDAANDARRFAEGVQGVLVDRVRLASQLQEDRAELQALQERLSVELDLSNSGASSTQAVEEWRRQIRVVEARVRAGQQALSVVAGAANAAQDRTVAAQAAQRDEGQSWEVVAAARELDMIEGRIDRMSLRAGVDGQITWIYRGEGEVVPAGEPVLQVRKLATRDVIAFLDAGEVTGLQHGDRATVRRSSGQVLGGKLVSVGSGPQPIPEALWHNPQYPEYAVPVRIELDGEVGPDEHVTVRL